MEDNEKCDCLVMIKTDETVEIVRTLLRADHCLGSRIQILAL